MVRLLRRIAVLALLLAAALFLVPRTLYHFGLLGPSTADRIAAARRAVQVARGYGARAQDIPDMAAAERNLAAAEALAAKGSDHDARHAAEEALQLAGQAQQTALVNREGLRLRAKRVVDTLDQRVDELEDLYSANSKGVGADRARHLFSRMKQTRAASAALVLAWEQQDYRTVVEGEAKALEVLDEMKGELQARR
jgi:Domain of unknown function (DUF4398)